MELQGLETNYLGRNVTFYETIDSTQLEIWRRINKNTIKNGELILTRLQTKGVRNSWKSMVYR